MGVGHTRSAMCRALCILLCAAGSRKGGGRAGFCAAAAIVEPMCLRGGGAARTEEGSAARGGRRNVACFDDREARFRLEREQAASVSAQRTPPGPRRGVTWDESNLEANRRDVEVCCHLGQCFGACAHRGLNRPRVENPRTCPTKRRRFILPFLPPRAVALGWGYGGAVQSVRTGIRGPGSLEL